MLISQLLAWISVFLGLMEILRFVARKSKVRSLNLFFHKIHIPFGVLLLVTGGLHGLVAGNFPDTTFQSLEWGSVFFSLNWGTAVYFCAALLGITYLLRKKLKKAWMPAHRMLTIIFIAILIFHIFDVGIHLQDHFLDHQNPSGSMDSTSAVESAPATLPPALTSQQTDAAESEMTSTQTQEAATQPTLQSTEEISPLTFSGAVLADGTYEGSAEGKNGMITVRVTVLDGQVHDIQVISHNEDRKYFSRAQEIIDSIFNAQSLQVDTVSGATLSSDGIKMAVYHALQEAVLEGELAVK